MEKIFENEDFILNSTGHDYDFVGTIEVKSNKPLTFFFKEELLPQEEDDEDCDEYITNENETEFLAVYADLTPYDEDSDDGYDEAEDTGHDIGATDWFTISKEDNWKGFLSDPKERGLFLALIKTYCPDKLESIVWVENGKSVL